MYLPAAHLCVLPSVRVPNPVHPSVSIAFRLSFCLPASLFVFLHFRVSAHPSLHLLTLSSVLSLLLLLHQSTTRSASLSFRLCACSFIPLLACPPLHPSVCVPFHSRFRFSFSISPSVFCSSIYLPLIFSTRPSPRSLYPVVLPVHLTFLSYYLREAALLILEA